ncbi:MAG: DNA cytosine methyltransferase [Bacilli bacterium]|nr:MAG: DNA cytosine methyltransferase [Bacilli bacterium]
MHNKTEKDNLGDITKINGKNIPYCDIWIGGFPCQDISMAGIRRGFDFNSNTRSSLGWKMIQFIREMDNPPKVVIFENVAAITNSKMRKKPLSLFLNKI